VALIFCSGICILQYHWHFDVALAFCSGIGILQWHWHFAVAKFMIKYVKNQVDDFQNIENY
jgi:hypothetical protein